MEQIKAEKAIWHKNCFRCRECNKQLKYIVFDLFGNTFIYLSIFFFFSVDTYQSHEGTVYCKPHFKALFAPKVVEDDIPQRKFPSFLSFFIILVIIVIIIIIIAIF